MKRFVYADNAATTRLDAAAFEAMKPYLLCEYGNASQPYSFARQPKKALRDARETVAACIGASPEEIFFTSGGTESDNWAVKGAAFQSGDRRETIATAIEHHAVLRACEAVARLGYPVAYLQPDKQGTITAEALRRRVTDQTRLVSVMYANNEIGSVQPVEELCSIAHEYGALFHTDAVQAVGHVEINAHALGVDLLSASAHKFNGPKGVGFLYIRNGTRISPYADGGAQEREMRAGTENVAGIVGMAVALKRNTDELQENRRHVVDMEKRFIRGLQAEGIPFMRNGGTSTLPGIVSLSFPGADGEAILHRLDLMGIAISTGAACNGEKTEISHVLRAIKLEESAAKGTVRISLGKENTEEDVEAIVAGLKKILE